MTIIQQLFIAYDDLETKYSKLIDGRVWIVISHEGSAFCLQADDQRIYMAEFSGARVLVVMNNTVLSFDDWVRIASCHH